MVLFRLTSGFKHLAVSLLQSPFFLPIRGKRHLIVVHVGKCGGKSVKRAIENSPRWLAKYRKISVWHTFTQKIPDINADYILILRNPIHRALSAFNYRYFQVVETRSDPRVFEGELEALSRAKSMNNLAESLYQNGELVSSAKRLFDSIHHLGDETIASYLDPILSLNLDQRIIAVLTTHTLQSDCQRELSLRIGHKHNTSANIDQDQLNLSALAISNLRKLLLPDYLVLEELASKYRLSPEQEKGLLVP
jgi:hypothetical protein